MLGGAKALLHRRDAPWLPGARALKTNRVSVPERKFVCMCPKATRAHSSLCQPRYATQNRPEDGGAVSLRHTNVKDLCDVRVSRETAHTNYGTRTSSTKKRQLKKMRTVLMTRDGRQGGNGPRAVKSGQGHSSLRPSCCCWAPLSHLNIHIHTYTHRGEKKKRCARSKQSHMKQAA